MTIPVWLRGTLLIAVTLVAGIAIGAGYERRRSSGLDLARLDAHHVMHRLSDHLGLDSVQQAAIAAIFAKRQGLVDSTWHTLQPQVRAMLDSTHREILAILTPEQAAKFRTLRVRHSQLHPQ